MGEEIALTMRTITSKGKRPRAKKYGMEPSRKVGERREIAEY